MTYLGGVAESVAVVVSGVGILGCVDIECGKVGVGCVSGRVRESVWVMCTVEC